MANSKAIGVAYEDQKIVGGTVDNTPVGATTASTGAFTTLAASGATTLASTLAVTGAASFGAASFSATVTIGNSAADLVGFHGAAAVDQYAFVADQSINALATGSVIGFIASTSLSSLVEKVNSILDLLIEKGLMAAS